MVRTSISWPVGRPHRRVTGIADGAAFRATRSARAMIRLGHRAVLRAGSLADVLSARLPLAERPRHPDGSATAAMEEAEAWASTIALTGQVLFNSDILRRFPSSGSRYYRRPCPCSRLLRAAIPGGAPERLRPQDPAGLRAVGRGGVLQLAKERGGAPLTTHLRFEDLGCDPGSTYLVYDYWVTLRRRIHGGLDVAVGSGAARSTASGVPRRAPAVSVTGTSPRGVSSKSCAGILSTSCLSGVSRVVEVIRTRSASTCRRMACPERGGGRRRTRAAFRKPWEHRQGEA